MSNYNNQLNNAHFNFITEVKFEKEEKSIPFKCWTEENKVYVKLNIEGGGTLSATMNLDFAGIFIQEAIPFMLEKEANRIKQYLKDI